MDTEQGESFAQLLGQRRSTIEERAAQLDGVIQGIDSFWRGADAENFRSEWSRTHGTLISQAVERLWALACELSDHAQEDRKSTRLNSSHVAISYAVFCLKKKKRQ